MDFVLFDFISTLPHSFFGHFSHRSEWQLIKIDYKSLYSRKCTEEDYQTWHLHNQVGKKQRHCNTRREHGRRWLTAGSASRVFPGRASRAWWDRSRFTWSAGQGTTACWEGTTPESCRPSPASAELTILNGKVTAGYPFDGHRGRDYVFLHCLWNGRLINDDARLTVQQHSWTRSFYFYWIYNLVEFCAAAKCECSTLQGCDSARNLIKCLWINCCS